MLQRFTYSLIKNWKNSEIKSNTATPNHELADKLCKKFILNFENRTLNSYFKDNIWGNDLDDMQFVADVTK